MLRISIANIITNFNKVELEVTFLLNQNQATNKSIYIGK